MTYLEVEVGNQPEVEGNQPEVEGSQVVAEGKKNEVER